ncbi:MAG: phosphoribosylformylglycinamidine synthase subunit PurQ [Firmicutes bacterium]|nr:phosphoribosylformylglycinamidine synthase subunit PurQ [Bacillota bacterium]MDH7496449.1 phosphoribosylformylglycinamidine synthase subunit PurQ [Bacillota bacterium]
MKVGIVVFPGSNCDADCYRAVASFGVEVGYVWHQDRKLDGYDLVILPGGFSYGDYLRAGAIARFSPILDEVMGFAEAGGLVLGICNGFQILLECGLLPGAMLTNAVPRFRCETVHLRVENAQTPFTRSCNRGQVLSMPIAHASGNYYADDETLAEIELRGQVVFRYVNEDGVATSEANPNGSRRSIAGITNKQGNVLGMMPHPERACDALLGGTDGRVVFASVFDFLAGGGERG